MKRVLFVIHSLGFGGAERSLVNLFNELHKDQFEIDLLLFQKKGSFLSHVPEWIHVLDTPPALNGLYAPVKDAGAQCAAKLVGTLCARLVRKTRKARAAWRWQHFYARRIQPLSRRYNVAIAYVGSEIMYFIADKVEADRKIVWIHNDYRTGGYAKAADEPYFRQMDAIVSVSEECVNVLREEFPQYADRMHYVQNITSSKAVRSQANAYEPEEFSTDCCNLLSVGRLMEQKGFDMAVEAAAILKRRGVKFRWYVIGAGVLQDALEKQISAAHLEDSFILLGSRSNPYPYIRRCSVFVQPSRYEGKSVVLDEAKILCKPIVVTSYPSAKDQISDGKEGIVVDMNPEAIADGIESMLKTDAANVCCEYLRCQEYGNQTEVEKYIKLMDE